VYALNNSRVAISSEICLKNIRGTCYTHRLSLIRVFIPWENDGAYLGTVRVQSNGIVAYIFESKAVAKVQPSISCKTVLILGMGNGFLTIRLFSSLKSLTKFKV
jgi:hypothetical protein